jgi:hypothetical protein
LPKGTMVFNPSFPPDSCIITRFLYPVISLFAKASSGFKNAGTKKAPDARAVFLKKSLRFMDVVSCVLKVAGQKVAAKITCNI